MLNSNDDTRSDARPDAWSRFRRLPTWVQVVCWLAVWPVPLALLAWRNPPSDHGFLRTVAVVATAAWFGTVVLAAGSDEGNDSAAQVPIDAPTSTEQQSGATFATPTTTRPVAPDGGFRSGSMEVGEDTIADRIARRLETEALLTLLDGLPVIEESPRDGYHRSLFPHWDDADGDGCDTRCEVLSSQRLADGTWFSEWDGATLVEPSEVHIDHVVALAEAWDSGADAWSAAERDAFADDRANLLAVSEAANVRKSESDAVDWFPSRVESNCLWASTVVRVKAANGLSVDADERDVLGFLLRTCSDYVPPTTTTTTTTTTAPPPPPPPPVPAPPPPSGNCHPSYPGVCIPPAPPDLDCGEIPFRRFQVVGSDPHRFDGDNDGIGCES